MIEYRALKLEDVSKLQEIDRSEHIDLIYQMNGSSLEEIPTNHECPTWDRNLLIEIQDRFQFEITNGGMAVGAFEEDKLVGFGVLAHQFRGIDHNQLQIDLMYVSRAYRRRGIGSQIFKQLSEEAKARGAEYLYISSTETRSAVTFYQANGSQLTQEFDEELFEKEPKDIHMIKPIV